MKKLLPLLLALSICALAADFWQAKPFTEWTDKDVQKLLTNSPWSKEVGVAMPSTDSGGSGSSKGGKRGGASSGGDAPLTGPSAGSGGGGGRGGMQDVGGGSPSGSPLMTLTVSWRTALTMREAVAKQKYGAEAGTSSDAKKMIEENQKYYAILVSGLPGRMNRTGDAIKDELLKNTSLTVKGKDPIMAADLQSGGNDQKAAVLFMFPKTSPIDADDKEVEFTCRLGTMVVKAKFEPKKMVVNGKLEL